MIAGKFRHFVFFGVANFDTVDGTVQTVSKLATLEEDKVPELAAISFTGRVFHHQIARGPGVQLFDDQPPHFDPSKKYPALTFTYGGPHARCFECWSRSPFPVASDDGRRRAHHFSAR